NGFGTSPGKPGLGLGGSNSFPVDSLQMDTPLPESCVLAPSDMLAVFHELFLFMDWEAHLGFGWPGVTWFGGKSFHQGGELGLFCDCHVESSKSELLPRGEEIRDEVFGSAWRFKPDEAHAKRWNNDDQPHRETWPQNATTS